MTECFTLRRCPALALSVVPILLACLLAGCPSSEAVEPGAPAEDLPPPDLSAVNLDLAVTEALDLLTRTSTRAVWEGHLSALDGIGSDCPTLWMGVPSGVGDGGEDGSGWQDDCTVGNYAFDGSLAWDAQASPDQAVIGRRNLAAIATVTQGATELFALRGEAADSLRLDEDGARWTYTSTFAGDVTGSSVIDPSLPAVVGGWRGTSDVTWVGGARWSLSASANVAYYEARIQETFDAVDIDTYFAGPGADELGCGLEPHGRISLRIPPGTWVDIDFWVAPPDDADSDATVSNPCDGCGTVSVRGLELGEACPDPAALWTSERLPITELTDFVLPVRELLAEDR